MNSRDPHTALKSTVVQTINVSGLEAFLVRLQWGKDDTGYSLHVKPTSFTSAGLQRTDFLNYLGFQRNDCCAFTGLHQCYCTWVSEGFNVEEFAAAFDRGYGHVGNAERALKACGFRLPQPEGWGFYYGKPSERLHRGLRGISGDGHTGTKIESMKAVEDDRFQFRFTFIDTGHDKAFVTHYRPRHLPVSSETRGVFGYLGLAAFNDCPEFDFEPCFFRTERFVPLEQDMWGVNVARVHRAFDAHASQFSPGIENLLAGNAAMETVGMSFLRLMEPAERMKVDIATKVILPAKASMSRTSSKTTASSSAIPDIFDVAISFAGTERDQAQQLAEALRDAGFTVFYDDFYPEQLWGKNLTIFFDQIFRKKARHCVMFVSKEYRIRKWTIHEAGSAFARALEEKGAEYILPIRVDDTELEGLLPTIGYVPISVGINKISEMLIKKLKS